LLGNYSHNFQNLANFVLSHPIPIDNIYHKYYDYTIIDLRVFFQYLRGKLLNVICDGKLSLGECSSQSEIVVLNRF
jgi:hypothetical protein